MINSFSFTNIIKTFMPGFFIFLALCVYINISCILIFKEDLFKTIDKEFFSLLITIAIPISIFSGVLLNSLFYKYHKFFFRFLSRKNKGIKTIKIFEKKVETLILEQTSKMINNKIEIDANEFHSNIYFDTIYLNKTGSADRIYLYNEFWNYMEFQIQFILVLLFSIPATLILFIHKAIGNELAWYYVSIISVLIILVQLLICSELKKAASENYLEFTKRTISYNIGVYLAYSENFTGNLDNYSSSFKATLNSIKSNL